MSHTLLLPSTKEKTSSVGIEPTTSRLTVERANRLRHEDMLASAWQVHLQYDHGHDKIGEREGDASLSCLI